MGQGWSYCSGRLGAGFNLFSRGPGPCSGGWGSIFIGLMSAFRLTIFIIIALFGLFFGAFLVAPSYQKEFRTVGINGASIFAEVVASADARRLGLSGREGMGANSGMLFVFDQAGLYDFWMKDMKFPLDII